LLHFTFPTTAHFMSASDRYFLSGTFYLIIPQFLWRRQSSRRRSGHPCAVIRTGPSIWRWGSCVWFMKIIIQIAVTNISLRLIATSF